MWSRCKVLGFQELRLDVVDLVDADKNLARDVFCVPVRAVINDCEVVHVDDFRRLLWHWYVGSRRPNALPAMT
jgi:hypothetical protein